MKRVLTAVAALAVALVAGAWRTASGPAPERGAVTSLSVVPTSGRAEVLIGIGGTVSVQDFTLSNPDRVVIDISGASLRVPTGGYDQVDRGGVLGIRYSQFSRGVVRVVVSLDAPHRYAVTREDGRIRVTVDGTSADFSAWHVGDAATTAPALAPAAQAPADDSVAPPAPAPLVSEASLTPVPVKVRPERRSTASARAASYGYQQQQPRITVTWENADIRDVVAAFSAYSGRTIILAKGVEATKITATITDQPWDVALRVVLNANGLDAVEDPSGILIVDTQAHILAQRAAEPLVTRSLRLNYVKAANLKSEIEARLTPGLLAAAGRQRPAAGRRRPRPPAPKVRRRALRSSPTSAARRAEPSRSTPRPTRSASPTSRRTSSRSSHYAKELDIRQPQVNIKAKIILVDRTSLEALGLQYDIGTAQQYFNQLVTRTRFHRQARRRTSPTGSSWAAIPSRPSPTRRRTCLAPPSRPSTPRPWAGSASRASSRRSPPSRCSTCRPSRA